mgnify:CR=1 FL=1
MNAPQPRNTLLGLAGWIGVTAAAAALGAMASIRAADFYSQLQRPSWAPPSWLFSPVWTTLYPLMALAAILVALMTGLGTYTLLLAGTAFLAGLITSLHCAGMCGPLACALMPVRSAVRTASVYASSSASVSAPR